MFKACHIQPARIPHLPMQIRKQYRYPTPHASEVAYHDGKLQQALMSRVRSRHCAWSTVDSPARLKSKRIDLSGIGVGPRGFVCVGTCWHSIPVAVGIVVRSGYIESNMGVVTILLHLVRGAGGAIGLKVAEFEVTEFEIDFVLV